MTKKKNFLLMLFSIFLTLVCLEIIFQFKDSKNKKYKKLPAIKRYMIFEEGDVFQPYDKFFKYHKNRKIRSEVFYKIDDKFIKEYSYDIITNNFGLVQKNDLDKSKKSILFLGDSFTEGQGAEAWVNYFNGSFRDFQIINGGILGTGPQQFKILEEHISKNYNVSKVFLFYLGGDFRRSPYNISEKTIICLKSHKNCVGDENFYGFPIKNVDPDQFLRKLENYRNIQNKKNFNFKTFRRNIKKIFSEFYVIKIPINFLKNNFYNSKNIKISKNFLSIEKLIEKYNSNIFFIQLLERNAILYGKEYESIYVEEFIKSKTKNHFTCNFDNNLSNFYTYDGHPNKNGYESLYKCVSNIMELNISN